MSPTEAADALIAEAHPIDDRGDVEAALTMYLRAAEGAPDYARAHMNVANALQRLGRVDEALAAHRRAVQCAPDDARTRFNLGSALRIQGDLCSADAELREALRLEPNMLAAMVVLADIYEATFRLVEAENMYRRALELDPHHAGTLLNFGMFCVHQNRLDEASKWFVLARESDPGLNDVESLVPFATNLRDDVTPTAAFEMHRRSGLAIETSASARFTHWINTPDPDRSLRIGYVSGDFRHHPVALFLRPVLERHDGRRFESFCYSNTIGTNGVSEALRARSRHWLDISSLDDDQLTERIRQDGIDVLVDLSGHTNRNRLRAFAQHPAPVQVTWLGYLSTSGLTAMDYRICDRHTDPEGETECFHTETLVRMPHSQWCYLPWIGLEKLPIPARKPRAQIVFGSFNQHAKISDACVDLWCRVLSRVPDSSLVLLDVNDSQEERKLLQRIERNGVDPSRIETRGRRGFRAYFEAIAGVDIALDTYPYSGATTTLDTLWMGTPVVALRGERAISRGTYSILMELGLDELIALDREAFVEINVRLANDAAWRAQLHETLRSRLEHSPLMDAARFVSDLEACFRQMWRNWCSRSLGA